MLECGWDGLRLLRGEEAEMGLEHLQLAEGLVHERSWEWDDERRLGVQVLLLEHRQPRDCVVLVL